MGFIMIPKYQATVNFAACLLFFLIGSIYATSIFNDAIDSTLPTNSPLRGRWSSSMGLATIFIGPVMLLSSILVDANGNDCAIVKTRRIKSLSAVGATFFLSFALASVGLRQESGWLVAVGVTLLAIPFGIFYYLCTELLAAWSNNAGTAIAGGNFAFGLGTISSIRVFSTLVQHFDAHTAVFYAGLLLTMPALVAALFLGWPADSVDSLIDMEYATEEVECRSELEIEVEPGVQHVSLRRLLHDMTFWQYQLVVFCSQTGFALVPYFFQFGGAYGASQTTIATLFQMCNAVGTAARLGGGVTSDFLGRGSNGGGARKLMIVLLGIQTIGFIVLSFTREEDFRLFMATSLFLFAAVAGGTCTCAILARDLFGAPNFGAVFACGGGLAIGLGESGATQIVAFTIIKMRHLSGPVMFKPAFLVLASFSLIGFLSAVLTRRSMFAFPQLSDTSEGEAMYGSTSIGEHSLDLRNAQGDVEKKSPGNVVTQVSHASNYDEERFTIRSKSLHHSGLMGVEVVEMNSEQQCQRFTHSPLE